MEVLGRGKTLKLNAALPKLSNNKQGQFSNAQTLSFLLSVSIHFSILSLTKIKSTFCHTYIFLTLALLRHSDAIVIQIRLSSQVGFGKQQANIAFDTKNTSKQILHIQMLQNFYKPSQKWNQFH